MANIGGVCVSFKAEVLQAQHNVVANNLKMALFLETATLAPSTTSVYSNANEVAAQAGVYTQGGKAITSGPVYTSGGTAYWTPTAALTWGPNFSARTDAALLYNNSNGNKAIAIYKFLVQEITAGNFMLSMPNNSAGFALLNVN